ncbi:MAG: rRNA maturation RNase YbeY [Alphaproteobacteria bacterium]|nr:rRNA maturation RNase YbeY [Alphaproteobacteria bacterium SS10]
MTQPALILEVADDQWAAALAPKTPVQVVQDALNAGHEELIANGKPADWPSELGWEVSVVLTDNDAVRELNRDYRGKDKPTNVLSFPQFETGETVSALPGMEALPIGDLILAQDVVATEAQARDIPIWQHVTHLVVHGLYHLVGLDHEDDEQAAFMEQLEVLALRRLGLDDPYRFDRVGLAVDEEASAQ